MLLIVRRVRLELGMTLPEAGSLAGVAAQTLGRIEVGRELPWPSLRQRLSKIYGLSESELFEDIDRAQAFLRSISGRRGNEE